MSRIVDIEPLLKKYDGMNEGTEFSPIHFINDLMALEQLLYGQPKQTCIEDYPTCTECEHYDSEKHYCPRFCQVIKDTLAEAQPSEDCISRQVVIDHICEDKECYKEECKGRTLKRCPDLQWVFDLPSVTPQLPKDATNGDMIKSMFPDSHIVFGKEYGYHYVYVRADCEGSSWKIREEWWNAPYKADKEG